MSADVLREGIAALSPVASSFYFETRGWTLVVPEHGHSQEALRELAREEWGGGDFASAEEWFSLHKRIKWCDRLDGFGCDLCGDWHRHLNPLRRGTTTPGARWTVIWSAGDPS